MDSPSFRGISHYSCPSVVPRVVWCVWWGGCYSCRLRLIQLIRLTVLRSCMSIVCERRLCLAHCYRWRVEGIIVWCSSWIVLRALPAQPTVRASWANKQLSRAWKISWWSLVQLTVIICTTLPNDEAPMHVRAKTCWQRRAVLSYA